MKPTFENITNICADYLTNNHREPLFLNINPKDVKEIVMAYQTNRSENHLKQGNRNLSNYISTLKILESGDVEQGKFFVSA